MEVNGVSNGEIILPIQLFIGKANVTRLNNRQMYPVVLYLLCFSKKLQNVLAVNVAFIPIFGKYSTSGRRLSDEVVRLARNKAVQDTLETLLCNRT